MELLQKLTLYDLLGYALPGSVLLIACNSTEINGLLAGGVINATLFVVLAFLAGIIVSEIAYWFKCAIDKVTGKWQWKKISQKNALTREKIEHALRNAHVISQGDGADNAAGNEEDDFEYVSRYFSVMYADIQCDPNYSRIHNYASAFLLYKNMFVVAVACAILGACRYSIYEIVVILVGALCFLLRGCRFNYKKISYTVSWFLEKYGNEQ